MREKARTNCGAKDLFSILVETEIASVLQDVLYACGDDGRRRHAFLLWL